VYPLLHLFTAYNSLFSTQNVPSSSSTDAVTLLRRNDNSVFRLPCSSKKWEDPESPSRMQDFKVLVSRLGSRPLEIGPLDGRNSTTGVYATGVKKIWKTHLRRTKDSQEPTTDADLDTFLESLQLKSNLSESK
jgi:hypothetical protein